MRSILVVALLAVACTPTTAVLDQGAPELGQSDGAAVLDGDWRIVFSDGSVECMTFEGGILIADDVDCDGTVEIEYTVPIETDEVGPVLSFELEDDSFLDYFFTDMGDGTFLVVLQIGDEIIDAGVASPVE